MLFIRVERGPGGKNLNGMLLVPELSPDSTFIFIFCFLIFYHNRLLFSYTILYRFNIISYMYHCKILIDFPVFDWDMTVRT